VRNTTIVVAAPSKKVSKPKKKKRLAPRSARLQNTRTGTVAGAYKACLQNPFSPKAIGAKIPSPFTVPTTTYRMVTEFSTYSAASSGAIMFLPNPLVSIVDLSGAQSTNSASACIDFSSTNLVRFNGTNTNKNYNVYGVTTPSQLTGVATSYRVAGWGVRIMNTASTNNCTGRFMVAKLPCIGDLPSYNLLTTSASDMSGFISNITGAPPSFLASPAIRELPESMMSSALEIMQRDCVAVSRPTSTEALTWRSCNPSTQFSSTVNMGDDSASYPNSTVYVAATSGGAVTTGYTTSGVISSGWTDQVMVAGHEAIIFYFDGASSNQKSYNIEVLYHLEVIPQLQQWNTSTSGAAPIPEPSPQVSTPPGMFENLVGAAKRIGNGLYYDLAEASQNWAQMRSESGYGRSYGATEYELLNL